MTIFKLFWQIIPPPPPNNSILNVRMHSEPNNSKHFKNQTQSMTIPYFFVTLGILLLDRMTNEVIFWLFRIGFGCFVLVLVVDMSKKLKNAQSLQNRGQNILKISIK